MFSAHYFHAAKKADVSVFFVLRDLGKVAQKKEPKYEAQFSAPASRKVL